MSEQRIQIDAVIPDGLKAVLALENYVRKHIDHTLYELVKLRASVINGCAFCLDMHSSDLLATGEDVRRVLAVAAWRESPFFTERERIAFEFTDTVTRIGEHGVPDDVWNAAQKEFGDEGVANLLLAVATINVWNRIAISSAAQAPPLANAAA